MTTSVDAMQMMQITFKSFILLTKCITQINGTDIDNPRI